MKVLDMTEPIDLASIYTDVNILEIPSHLRAMPEDELMESVAPNRENVNRLAGIHKERIDGFKAVDKHRRLFILGKPGAGKTTFMKRLAFDCAEGKFRDDLIPVFVTLNDLAQAKGTLAAFVANLWGKSAADSDAESLLHAGLAFLLLDGLDEVHNEKLKELRDEVETFCIDYPSCPVVMTCRIAAQQYNFQHFKDVEMADFNREQIGRFVSKWFSRKENAEKGKKVLAELDGNESILELGSSPLLLTMLCLLADSGITLTGNRAYVYEKGVDVLLQRWDKSRDIERDWPYKRMNPDGRRLLLSEIAYWQFVKGSFFFRKDELESQIRKYFDERPALLGAEDQFSAFAVLQAIESQHGFLVQRAQQFYSFSHLTFQEYFAAKRIHDGQHLLPDLVSRIADVKWREVMLLTASVVDPIGYMPLLKAAVDRIAEGRPNIQRLLSWVFQKAAFSGNVNSRLPVLAFCFAQEPAVDGSVGLLRDLNSNLERAFSFADELALDRASKLASSMKLEDFKNELCALQKIAKGQNKKPWREELRQVALKHRNIGHKWGFTEEDHNALNEYYTANRTLVACLKAAPGLSATLRRQIEESMLLPESELKKIATLEA